MGQELNNVNPCPTCKKHDHIRSTNKKCLFHKPRIRERNRTNSELDRNNWQIFSIKKGLATFVCPLLDPKTRDILMLEINRDIQIVSKLFIELSYLMNRFHKHYLQKYSTKQFLEIYPRPEILALVYRFKSSSKKRKLNLTSLKDEDRILDQFF